MRARCIGVLGCRHLHLPRTIHTTCAFIKKPAATRGRQYSTSWHDFGGAVASRAGVLDEQAEEVSSLHLSVEDRRLLGRARLHGIRTLDQLRFETDLGHSNDIGSRLLDRREKRQDLDLWLFVLDVNRQHRGFDGLKATWRGLIFRGPKVELETHNANARDLMDAFIYAGITEDLLFLREVVRHSLKYDYFITDLFVAVIGGLLRYRPDQASAMVPVLRTRCFQSREDLLQIFRMACLSTQPDALKHFQRVLDHFPETDLYHDTISYLWEHNRPADAFALHDYLIARRDRPKAIRFIVPFIGYLAYSGQPLKSFLRGLQASGMDGYRRQSRRIYEREVKRLQQNSGGFTEFDPRSVDAGERSKLPDHTIARILATATFSFDFLITAVSAFGTVELGPLAVRQMVLSSPDLSTLDARFGRLSELDIDTGSSVYVIIINRLRVARNWELLRLIAESDMHHEEFANTHLQRRLLNQYLAQGRSQDLTRTLTILNEGYTDHAAQENSVNLLFRSAAINHDWRRVLDIATSLHQTDFRIKGTFLAQLTEMLLPLAKPRYGFHPTFNGVAPFDVAHYLIGILQQLLATRTNVCPSDWRPPLVRLARNNLEKVHHLSLFLADHYTSNRCDPATNNDLHKLFTPAFQRALIAWDFIVRKWRDTLQPNSSSLNRPGSRTPKTDSATPSFESPYFPSSTTSVIGNEPWLRGARLLKELRDKYGLTISLPDLEKEYLLRLQRMTYARGSFKVVSNKNAAKDCGYSYKDFAEQWENLWYPETQQVEPSTAQETGGYELFPDVARDNFADGSNETSSKVQIAQAGDSTIPHVVAAIPQGRGRLRAEMMQFLQRLHTGEYAARRQRHAQKRAQRRTLSRGTARAP